MRLHHRLLGAAVATAAILAGLTGCGDPTTPATPAATRSDRATVERGIVYRTVAGQALALDACLPPTTGRPSPALVLVHGGGFRTGGRADLDALCSAASAQGIAAFSVDYRLLPARYPAQVQDVGAAIDWIGQPAQRRRFHLRPGSTAILGSSAGAVIAAQLITGMPGTPKLNRPLVGAVLLSGVYDLDQPLGDAAGEANTYVGCDGDGATCETTRKSLSAARFVHTKMPPVLLVNGRHEYIPLAQLRAFARALRAKHDTASVYVSASRQHADAILNDDPIAVTRVVTFLRSVLPVD